MVATTQSVLRPKTQETKCDGGHFATSVFLVLRNKVCAPFWRPEMAKAMEMTHTRFARWYNAFRQNRYYSRFE